MVIQMSAAEATELMRSRGISIGTETLRDGLLDRRYPFGECFKTRNGHDRCIVYRKLLDQWLDERDSDK